MLSTKITNIVSKIKKNLTNDLRKSKYKNNKNYLVGHCYVASEALYHILGGKPCGWKPMFIKHENQSHWFIKNIKTNIVIDITEKQFKSKIFYDKAIGKGFLTKKPSKRAKELMKRISI